MARGEVTVCALAIAPIKGTRVRPVDRIEVDRAGVREDRRFYLIDSRGRMQNGKHLGALSEIVATYADAERHLTVTFPDGRIAAGDVRLAEPVATHFFSLPRPARLVEGPWSAAISEWVGRPLRLVEPDEGSCVDRGLRGAVSLVSRGSLARLADVAGIDRIDARRFRMLIEIDGVRAHEEDRWVRDTLRVGAVRIAVEGHVGRCLVTSRDPDTGEIDLPTLDLLGSYRGDAEATAPLPFGIHGSVLEPGSVAVGDWLALDG